ncbi:MAG: hypothetical protein QOJ35_2569 [Solirubrobacteraceae bacterium]|nr:hypothetical protein [Solirubrobacteraceae bacterium]
MAGLTVQCRDEMGDGEWLGELRLHVDEATTTPRELIRRRVEQETGQHNAELDRGRQFRGLVTAPPSVTSELNGWHGRKREGKPVDGEQMLAIALDAFARGDLVLVVDDEPAAGIDSALELADGSVAVFRKQVPLVVPQTNPGRVRSKHELLPE